MADQPATGPPQNPQGTEGDPIHVVSRKEDDPIHVVSRSAPSTGWAGVMSGVEEFDKEEIQGYKEDMDALLVFIGLFSAVLAGFVNGSYNSLKADPADLMLLVMTGMSIQAASYTIQGGFINSTAPAPTSLPPFEPTHNAVVVNILWTASLVASLSAASGAIFVKQWLRGYTASATSFALHRMRIRYFRRLALEDWHVLGIASVLPFLLQISLVLFFVGLCYFTADIHPSVKNTTFPLVSAWAFFFVSATLLPLFSARCPYKTPALDPLTTLARKRLRRVWEYGLRTLKPIGPQMEEEQDTSVPRVAQPAATFRIVTGIRQWAGRCISRLNDTNQPHDEISATKTNAFDLRILLQADRLHGNDEVVDAAISHAVLQSKPPWQDTIVFALQLLHNRLPSEQLELAEPRLVDLTDLTPRAVAAVINIVNYVQPLVPQTGYPLSAPAPDAEAQTALWTAFLRVSASFSQRCGEIAYYLEHFLDSTAYAHILARESIPLRSTMVLQSMLTLLCQRLERADCDFNTSVLRLEAFLGVYFNELDVPGLFKEEQLRSWSKVLNGESLGPAVAWLTQQLKSDIATPAAGSSDIHSRETAWGNAVSLIVKLVAVAEDISNFFNIRGVALKSSKALRQFWISCFNYRLHESWDLVPRGGLDAEGLSNIKTAIAALASDPPPEIDREKVLSLCRDLCESLWWDCSKVRASNLVPARRAVFDALTLLVQRTQVEDSDAARNLVNRCFYWIKDIDGIDNLEDDAKYTAWLATFNPEDSPIPDEFIKELLHVNPNPQYPAIFGSQSFLRLWRIRRIQDLSSDVENQVGRTGEADTLQTPFARSDMSSDDQERKSQPDAAAAGKGNAQVGTTSPVPMPHGQSVAPSEVQDGVGGTAMSLIMNSVTSEHVPNTATTDSQDVLQSLDAHFHPLDHLPTDMRGSEEGNSVEIHTMHSNRDANEVIIRPEETPPPVELAVNNIAEDTTIDVEDVISGHQAEGAYGDPTNRDEQQLEQYSVPARHVTLSNVPSLPANIIAPGPSSQDIPSEHNEGGKRSSTSPGTSIAVHGAVNHQLEADMKNASTGLYSAPAVTLSSSSYAHPSHPDRPPETSHRESEGSSARRSSVGEDGKESTHGTGPPGSDTIQPTDAGNTDNNETTVSPVHGGPVYSVRREDDEGDRSRDGGGNVSSRGGTEDGGGGDHP